MADSAALNASTGAGIQNFSDTYNIPANTLGARDTLEIDIMGTVTRAAAFNFVVGLSVQGIVRGTVTYAALGGSTVWRIVQRITLGANPAARCNFFGSIGGTSVTGVFDPFYDSQNLDVTAAALVQCYVTMSGGNAGNIAVQTFRSVRVIKAAA